MAGLIAGLAIENVPLSEIGRYSTAVESVTARQVEDVSAALLDPSAASTVIVGNAADFLSALRARGLQPETIPASALDLDSVSLRRNDAPLQPGNAR